MRTVFFTLILLTAIAFCCGCTGTQNSSPQQGGGQDIVVGALLPLTGDTSETGQASNASLAVAAEDINAYFASIGSDHRVKLVIEDTATDPAIALEKLKLLDRQGIRLVIGPESSAEVDAVRTYADGQGIVIISTMSTVPSLALQGDTIFRFVPPDTLQADAMAYFLQDNKISAVVPVWRNDIWGNELRNLTAKAFTTRGGTVRDGVSYQPDTENYSATVEALDREVGQAITVHGKEKTAVYAVTYSEVVPIMAAAAKTKNLSEVRWYGSDSNVLIGSLLTAGDATRFAAQANFTGPTFGNTIIGLKETATYGKIRDRLGRQPNGYSLASYDALWVATITSTQATGTMDKQELKNAVAGIAAVFTGPFTGPLDLDAAGDRSSAHYGFWSVKDDGNTYRWAPVAQYDLWVGVAKPNITKISS
jgi:branched-chain amino acid transport system substrate-binding protein